MFRKRNLIALLMAAMLSLGTIGVVFADGDSGSALPATSPEQQLQQQLEAGSIWA
jgi:hypothetical protein